MANKNNKEKHPDYAHNFFRGMPVSDKEQHTNNFQYFQWSRVFLGFQLLPIFTTLCFALSAGIILPFKNGEISLSFIGLLQIVVNFILVFLGLSLIGVIVAFIFGGIQSFIWSIILEILHTTHLKIKMACATIGGILVVAPVHFFATGICELFGLPIFLIHLSAAASGVIVMLMLHKNW
ncbi:MAG: hypothetical protein IJV35_05770 [Neisseriaceae bacterium]|nr:hypothetical protein [Neisseriaceae bacterium]